MFKAHIKLSVLRQLSRKNLTGYDIMKYMREYGDNASPGYIYPLLNDLEVNDFISVKSTGRRKVYTIKPKGKELLKTLQKNKQEMIAKMTSLYGSLTDKKELSNIIKSKKDFHKYDEQFRDLFDKFHSVMVRVDDNKRKKIRLMLKETLTKIEKL
jgi:DNA-binding PadR family transcriptional regulator